MASPIKAMFNFLFVLSCLHLRAIVAFSPSPAVRVVLSSVHSKASPALLASKDDKYGIATVEDASTAPANDNEPKEHLDAVVCGGGPAGLLSAIMLAQRFPERQIHVFESSPTPPLSLKDDKWNSQDALARFYTLGVFGRGKKALEHFGVWESVAAVAQELVGNQAWRSPDAVLTNANATLFADQGRESIFALPRDKLVSALYEHILEEYNGSTSQIRFHFGQTVTPIDFEYNNNLQDESDSSNSVLLEIEQQHDSTSNHQDERRRIITTDFLIGSDGAARTVANRMEEVERQEWKEKSFLGRLKAGSPFKVARFPDTNPRVYKTIPVQLPSDWRKDIGYSASNFNDKKRRYSIVSLPSNTQGGLCAILLMKKGDPLAALDTDPQALRAALDDNVPVFSNLVDDDALAAVAKKPPSNFPFFRYAGPRLHKGDRTVILGDACHSVKPYNGLGVNSAFEDVQILSDILEAKAKEENNANFWKSSVEAFSKTRAKDCKAVVTLSRAGDRPGRIGFLSYLIPLLMDAMFHKALPALFEPPIPGLIHSHDKYRFHQVAVRKRWERLAQVSILAAAATMVGKATMALVRRIAVTVGQKTSTVSLGLTLPLLAFALARKFATTKRKA